MTKQNSDILYHELTRCLQAETPAESEILLPDYCPGIMKIVRTDATPFIRSATVRGDRAFIEGTVEFRILYLSDTEEGFRCVFYRVPFSCSTETHCASPDTASLRVTASLSYINTRALSPQKLYAKSVVSLSIRVIEPSAVSLADTSAFDGLIARSSSEPLSDILMTSQKIVKITDEIVPSDGKNPSQILRYEMSFGTVEKKIINNKMIVKTDMAVRLYYCENAGCETIPLSKTIPISQVLELPEGITENNADVRFELSDVRFTVKEDSQTQTSVEMDAEICVFALCQKESSLTLVKDAYSVTHDTVCEPYTVTIQSAEPVSVPLDLHMTVPCEDADTVCDVISSVDLLGISSENGTDSLGGKLICDVLYRTREGDYTTIRKECPFSYPVPSAGETTQIQSDLCITQTRCEWTQNTSGTEIRFTGVCTGTVFRRRTVTSVKNVTVGEKRKEKRPALTVCFAAPGESIWDISKKYGADPESVRKENALDGDTVSEKKKIFVRR